MRRSALRFMTWASASSPFCRSPAKSRVRIEARDVGAEGSEDPRALDVLLDLVEAERPLLEGKRRVVLEGLSDRRLDERREPPAEEGEDLLRSLRSLGVRVLRRR